MDTTRWFLTNGPERTGSWNSFKTWGSSLETLSASRLVFGPLLWTLYCQKNFSPPPPPPVPEDVPEMLEALEQADIVRRRRALGVRGRQLSFEFNDDPVEWMEGGRMGVRIVICGQLKLPPSWNSLHSNISRLHTDLALLRIHFFYTHQSSNS